MIRLTRKVFNDLSIWMMGFGLIIGVIFPFFVTWMGIPSEYVMTPWFFGVCILAGIIVGAVNIRLTRMVVGARLTLLADRMQYVTHNLKSFKNNDEYEDCTAEKCLILVDSEDVIGQSAQAFNMLVQALSESIQTESSLSEFTQMLASQLSINEMTTKALQKLMSHANAAAGAILIEGEGDLTVAISLGIRDASSIIKSDHVLNALRTESRQILSLPENVMVEGVLTDFRPREVIIEPILYKEVVLGLIILANATTFTQDALNRLELFRQGLALALHNALLFDRLERLAAVDPLTSTYNRRFGLTRLHEEFGRSLRNNSPLGVLMFDIDHFKIVNDTYGHLAGDRVLVRIANVSRNVLREGDILIRYGGEEFLALLPGTSRDDVGRIAERLRHRVSEASVIDGEETIKVTISVGGISFPQTEVVNETEMVNQADKALYKAKEGGRNRVVLASE